MKGSDRQTIIISRVEVNALEQEERRQDGQGKADSVCKSVLTNSCYFIFYVQYVSEH